MTTPKVNSALGNKFTFTIANASESSAVIALLAAFFDTLKITVATTEAENVNTSVVTKAFTDATNITAAGYTCDTVADDGTIASSVTLTAANSKMSYRQFREYIKNQPQICREIIIQASNSDVFNSTLEVIRCTPLSGAKAEYLTLSDFRSVDQQATDKIVIKDANLEMSFDTLMLMTVGASRTVTVTFKF